MKLGSLFSGIGGIELGLGFDVAWHNEIDPAASTVLKRHWPGVPNLGDITQVDWAAVEPVDIICGGFPCQDISVAGKGAGITEGTRSGLWSEYANAVSALRPRYVFVENVAAIFTNGLGRVLGDLAALGYDAEWHCLRASDVGAPHRRERLFLLATNTDSVARATTSPREGRPRTVDGPRTEQRTKRLCSVQIPTDTESVGGYVQRGGSDDSEAARNHPVQGTARRSDSPVTDAEGAERRGPQSQGMATALGATPELRERISPIAWGDYGPAIERWERLTRPAPEPTTDGKLSPAFVEWLMGFPEGWTDGLSRADALRCLGNAVVPQCAALAWDLLAASNTEPNSVLL